MQQAMIQLGQLGTARVRRLKPSHAQSLARGSARPAGAQLYHTSSFKRCTAALLESNFYS